MASNIEIKVKISNMEEMLENVRKISDKGPELLCQKDVFYKFPMGRLKLRSINEQQHELIYYIRSNTKGPKKSTYYRVRVTRPLIVHSILRNCIGVKGVVEKKRQVYFVDRTRIHMDSVQNLGDFLELEVAMRPSEKKSNGIAVAEWLKKVLCIDSMNLIDRSYLDLIVSSENALTKP